MSSVSKSSAHSVGSHPVNPPSPHQPNGSPTLNRNQLSDPESKSDSSKSQTNTNHSIAQEHHPSTASPSPTMQKYLFETNAGIPAYLAHGVHRDPPMYGENGHRSSAHLSSPPSREGEPSSRGRESRSSTGNGDSRGESIGEEGGMADSNSNPHGRRGQAAVAADLAGIGAQFDEETDV